jgi:hypothetical protein
MLTSRLRTAVPFLKMSATEIIVNTDLQGYCHHET